MRRARSIVLFPLALTLCAAAGAAADKPSPASNSIVWQRSELSTLPHSFAVVCTDLNGDGDPDLALTHSPDDGASVCLGEGDGTFAPCVALGRVGDNPRGLAAADFNRDGAVDLALGVTQDGTIVVLNGFGDGRFAAPRKVASARHPFLLTSADLNRDGIADLAVAQEDSGLVVLLADGRGGFRRTAYKTGKWSSDVAAADFNTDGLLDLAVTNWGSNDVSVLLGKESGSFSPARNITYEGEFWEHHSLYRVLAADLDRDGHADMVWNDIIKQSLYIVYGDGTGGFPRHASVAAGRGVRHADAADFDGDGWLDLVSANTADDEITVILADATGGFLSPQRVPVGRYPRMAVTCDLNRDARPDVVVSSLKAGGVHLLINQGRDDARAAKPLSPPAKGGSRLKEPSALLIDAGGQLIVADEGNHRVVRIDAATGSLTTVAGSGHKGFAGDGGPALDARFNRPSGLARDEAGNLYVADHGNNRIRKVDASGLVSSIAGTGKAGDQGDGAAATEAQLHQPIGIAVGSDGGLFIADSGNHRVRKVDANGVISTVAGSAAGYAGDGGPATAARLSGPGGLALDRGGALLITDRLNNRVRKLGRDGQLTTIAGNGTLGAAGDGAAATAAQLGYPISVSVADDGTIYVADSVNRAIRAIAPDGVIRTVAAASGEQSWEPAGVAADRSGGVFFTDRRHDCVRRIDPDGRVRTIAGPEGPLGVAHEVEVAPEGIDLLAADKVTPPVVLAWQYTYLSGSDDNSLYGVAAGPAGDVYVAGDTSTGADWRVQRLDAEGNPGWHFDFGEDGIDVPLALALGAEGQIVAGGTSVGSEENGRDATIIALDRDGHERWRYRDATPGEQSCRGLAIDAAGNVYAAGESGEHWDLFSLDSEGRLRWRQDGLTSGMANAVSVIDGGSLFVAGTENGAWRAIKMNPDHSLAWEHRIAGRGAANAIQATSDGGAVVVGARTTSRMNLRAERLNASGQLLWEYEASSPAGAVVGRAVTFDADGMPIIAGEIGSDWLVLALDAQGKRRWHFTHDGGGGLRNRDQAFAIAFAPPDRVVVAGRIHRLPMIPPSLGQVEWRAAAYRIPGAAPP